MEKEPTVTKERKGKNNAGKNSDINPKDRCKRGLHRAYGKPARFSMTMKFQERARTNLEENQSRSKESTALEWSTSAPPAGGGDRGPPRTKRDRSAGAEDRNCKPEGQEQGEWSPAGAGRETPGVPPGTRPTVGGDDPARASSEEEEG